MDAVVEYEGRKVCFYDINDAPVSIEATLQIGGWYEIDNLRFIQGLQVRGSYADVGAYIGTHSLFFSLFCPSTTVYSFEPQPTVYPKLKRNLEANGAVNCKTFNLALSDISGYGSVPGEYGGARLVYQNASASHTVRIVPLDSLGLKDITLLKVDAENSELRVLRGATETLKSVEHLFIEMWKEPICKQYGVEYTAPAPGVFKAPAGCEIMKWCIEQQRKLNWKTCAWAALGPYMLFAAVNHFKMQERCKKQDTFLPPMSIPEGLVSIIPPRTFGAGTYAIHLHNEMWRGLRYDKNAAYPPTSIYGQLQVKYLSPALPENPKVSVIISCYNYGKYLAQAIDSALAQTYSNVEVVVVDDGSTDDSLKIAQSYGAKITVLTQPNSGSPTFARNKGLENSTGELVVSLDADDWLEPTFIEKTLPHMKPGIGAVTVLLVGMAGKDSMPTLRQMTEGNQCAQTALMRRQAVLDAGGWVDTGYEDWNLWISMMEAGWQLYTVGEGLYNYRRHGNEGRYLEKLHPYHDKHIADIHALHPELYKALKEKPRWPLPPNERQPLYVFGIDPSKVGLYVHTPDPSKVQPAKNPLVADPEPKIPHETDVYIGFSQPKNGKKPLYVHTPDPSLNPFHKK